MDPSLLLGVLLMLSQKRMHLAYQRLGRCLRYTHGNYRGKGYSKLLYGLAFYLVNKDGAGLTSDHWSSTSKSAKDRSWDNLISRGQVVPRKTPGIPPFGGHSEFDYGNEDGTRKTPKDRLDDCEAPSEGPAATDSSLVLKNYTKFEPIYLKLTQRHEDVCLLFRRSKLKNN